MVLKPLARSTSKSLAVAREDGPPLEFTSEFDDDTAPANDDDAAR